MRAATEIHHGLTEGTAPGRRSRDSAPRRGPRFPSEVPLRSRGTAMTTKAVKAAFRFDGFVVKLDQLRPTKQVRPALKETPKYKAIVASIREVGVIEPLIV